MIIVATRAEMMKLLVELIATHPFYFQSWLIDRYAGELKNLDIAEKEAVISDVIKRIVNELNVLRGE